MTRLKAKAVLEAKAVLIGAAICVVTACGGGHSTPQVAAATGAASATPTSTPASMTRLLHDAAQCLRDHGIPTFPDPVLDSRGNIQIADNLLKNLPVAVQQTAENACKSQINAAEQLAQTHRPAATPQELAQATKLAQCMRRHGWPNFPDPDPSGGFSSPGPGAMPASKADPGFQACRSQLGTRGA